MHPFISMQSGTLLPVLLTWFEELCPNEYTTTVAPADLCCSMVSFLVSVCCTMTLPIGKITCNFISLGGFVVGFLGWLLGVFLMNLHEEILRLPAFPLPFQLPPQMKHSQVFVSSVVLHFSICVLTSWDVSLAAGVALSCVALILSQSRGSALVVQGTWGELWASWACCQHSGDLTAEDRFVCSPDDLGLTWKQPRCRWRNFVSE